jgi:hypothetical protein
MTESEIQKQIVDFLKLSGCLVFRMNAGKRQNNMTLAPAGTPDLMAITRCGDTIWLEVKTETGKLRETQEKMIAELVNRFQAVYLVRSVEDVKKSLQDAGIVL